MCNVRCKRNRAGGEKKVEECIYVVYCEFMCGLYTSEGMIIGIFECW